MALIKCPECKRDVSDKAVYCPNCGYPIEEYIKNINRSDMSMEFDIDVEDVTSDKYVKNVNGIRVDISNLLLTHNFSVSASAKNLNAITKIGIIQANEIIDEFIKEYPEYDKEKEFDEFIKVQAELTHKFRTDKKIGKLCIDYEAKLFRIGFWSYIYKFEEIDNVIIGEESGKIYVEISTINEYIPNIKINIPNFKNLKKIREINSIRDLSLKNTIVTKEEAMEKAVEIRDILLEFKGKNGENIKNGQMRI